MAFCPPIPTDHPRIATLTQDEMRAAIDRGEVTRFIFSTACWRGYVGTWEVRDGRLSLVKIEGRYRLVGDDPLFADWVTAVLRIPGGQQLHYVHMGFGSVYEFETHLKIEAGAVVEERRIDNRGRPIDHDALTWGSLPGSENRFEGDDLA